MENQFTALTKSYHDNFLEYKLSGSESAKQAYMDAEESIQSLLSTLNANVGVQNDKITNFYNSDIQNKIRSMKSDIMSTQKRIVTTKDKLTAAQMRQIPESYFVETKEPIPITHYVGIGILLTIGALLTAL